MKFCYFHRVTGALHGNALVTSEKNPKRALAMAWMNAPDGHAPIEGDHDHRCKKVDLETRQIVDHMPEAPSEHHEWHEGEKRWRLSEDAQQLKDARQEAQAKLRDLEAQIPVALLEDRLGIPGATEKLKELHERIISQRVAAT